MPHIPIAHERVPTRTEQFTIEGQEVKVYAYAEQYYHQLSLLRGLVGLPETYEKRHLRAEAPEYYHSRASPDISYQEQRQQLLKNVRAAKRKKKDLAERVM